MGVDHLKRTGGPSFRIGTEVGLPTVQQPPLLILPGMRGEPGRLLANADVAGNAFSAARAAEIIRYVRLGFSAPLIEEAIKGFDKGVTETMHHLFSGEPKTDPVQARIRAEAILTRASEAYQEQ